MTGYSDVMIFAQKLGLDVLSTDAKEELMIVSDEEKGICNLVIDCEFPILIMEQLIYQIKNPSLEHFQRLLQMNRQLVHGAFVLDEEGKNLIFRDTLRLENLDFNEFEGSVNALSLGLAEFSSELLAFN